MTNGQGSQQQTTVRPQIPGRRAGGPMAGRMNAEKPKDLKKVLSRLLKYIGRYKLLLLALLFITLIVTAADLMGPALQGNAINTISYDSETGKFSVDFESLLKILATLAGIYVFSSLLSYFQGFISNTLSQKTVYLLRKDLFKKISELPISYTDNHSHGDIMSRMTNDVENVSNTISSSVSSLISSLLTLIGALVMMLYYSWQLTLIAMVTIPLTLLVTTKLAKFMRKYYVQQQKHLGELNGQSEEMVTGFKTVIEYGREESAVDDFEKTSDALCKVGIKARILGGIMGPCMNIIGNLQYLLLATAGGYFALKGIIPKIGSIQSVLQYSKRFTRPVNEIANQFTQILTALAGAERIFQILDENGEFDDVYKQIDQKGIKGEIVLEDVCFSYVPGKKVLKGINLKIEPGKKIAIVGATGSGKTTIVNLITRFYEIDSGKILIDGIDIHDLNKKELRSLIGLVLQDTVLFSDTIERNIRMGSENATFDEIRNAACISRADDFIERLPQKYSTVLTEAGDNLSQGQKQLISIARAILKDPKILILDEATSNVDTRTEYLIQQGLASLMKNRTSLVIAHRLSTIIDADEIVVIKDGTVAEMGNHEELLKLNGEYANLYKNQYAGVET